MGTNFHVHKKSLAKAGSIVRFRQHHEHLFMVAVIFLVLRLVNSDEGQVRSLPLYTIYDIPRGMPPIRS